MLHGIAENPGSHTLVELPSSGPLSFCHRRAFGSKRVKAHLLLNSLSPEQIPISPVNVPLAKMKHVPLLDAGVLACVAPDWVAGPQ